MKVAAIGDNCLDVYPALGKSYPTGNAVDFAVNIRRLGASVAVISVTGDDYNGRLMRKTLAEEGIDLSHFYTGRGSTAITYMAMEGNDRVHGDYQEGVLETMRFSAADIAFAAAHDLVHSAFWGKADAELQAVKNDGALISFDYATKLDDEMVERTLPFVDYAFFSYAQGRDAYIEEYLVWAVGRGAKVAVATSGAKGSLAYDGRDFHQFGIIEAAVVNTVGAGDAFIAGFIHAALAGLPTAECLRRGAAVAAKVITVFGPWEPR
jgi:fructoselysine 6-kinase